MKRILHLTILCLLLSGGIGAQVTIGSGQKPNAGALLDLKTEPDGTSKQGMVLPRVKLSDIAALTIGTNVIANANNAWTNHAGLVVYNISGITPAKCAPIPDGLYVWDGAKWNGINTPTPVDPATLDVGTKTYFDLPSGRDARPLTAQSFTATWTPGTLPYINTPHASFGGVSFSGANALPVSPLAASPVAFNLLPDAMADGDIATNPFSTKESTLAFDVAANECYPAQSKTITLNQTNKALTVSTPLKEYTADASDETNTLTTNADWKLASIMPADATNAISNVRVGSPTATLATGVTQTDYEQNNNAGKAATLTYDIAVGSAKSRYSTLTFADASSTKRFSDVTITVLQCTNVGLNPTIEQWALTAGFTQTEIDDVKSSGTDSRKLATGLQMHRVANTPRGLNQIFLSSNFGANPQDDDERWMIHNLDSKAYDGVAHSEPRALSGPNGNAADTEKTAYWAYPKPDRTITTNDVKERVTYDNNQRLGLLYTWDAATAGKGGTNGQTNVDNSGALQESGFREGTLAKEQKRRQGICPSGWHLPSDDEWSLLEQNIVNNKSSFSSLATSTGGTLSDELTNATYGVIRTNVGVEGQRGHRGLANNPNGHGNAMKEVCELGIGNSKGASHGINSTDRPGFDVLLAGYATNGSTKDFGNTVYFWSASSDSVLHAWDRAFYRSQVFRNFFGRSNLISVRCKK